MARLRSPEWMFPLARPHPGQRRLSSRWVPTDDRMYLTTGSLLAFDGLLNHSNRHRGCLSSFLSTDYGTVTARQRARGSCSKELWRSPEGAAPNERGRAGAARGEPRPMCFRPARLHAGCAAGVRERFSGTICYNVCRRAPGALGIAGDLSRLRTGWGRKDSTGQEEVKVARRGCQAASLNTWQKL